MNQKMGVAPGAQGIRYLRVRGSDGATVFDALGHDYGGEVNGRFG